MSDTQTVTPSTTSAAKLARVKGSSIGAVFMLVIQFILGIVYGLYGTMPAGKSIGMFSNGWLIGHEIMALLLLAAAISLVVRAFGTDSALAKRNSVIGLIAVIAAIGAGLGFLPKGDSGASLGMSIAFAVALVFYAVNILRLPSAE